MPIYEFECKKCGETFDVLFRSLGEKVAVACPLCTSTRTRKLMSAFSGKIGNTSGGASCGSCTSTSCSTT